MKRPVGFGAFPRALAAALQWKLLLLWFLLTLVPALVVSRPLHGLLASLTDHSVHADAWAKSFHGLPMTDILVDIGRHGMPALSAAFAFGTVLMLLFSPFLTGMSVTAVRGRQLGFGDLMHGGLSEYWRLFRFLLWALVLYAIVAAISAFIFSLVSAYSDKAILESNVDFWGNIGKAVILALFVIAQSMIEAGRGRIVAEPNLRSATRAFFAGIGTLFRRPLVTLGMFVGVTALGYVITLLLGMWRMRVAPYGVGDTILALLVLVLLVMSMAWMRTARLAGMAAIAEATPSR